MNQHSISTEFSRRGSAYNLTGVNGAPALVFIHGLGLNRKVWDQLTPRFTSKFQVLSYDLFGHGESVAPPVKPSVTLFSEQLVELMDELNLEQAVLVGFSLGGMINRRVAIDHPGRVLALAILNSPHEREPSAQCQVEQRALDSTAGGPAANLDATIERWFTEAFRSQHGEFINRVRHWVLANDAEVYALCRQVLAFGVVELIRPDPPIEQATLVMTCEHDSGSTPAMSRAIANEIAGAQVIIVPGLQHMGLTEKPTVFADALCKFLDSLGAS